MHRKIDANLIVRFPLTINSREGSGSWGCLPFTIYLKFSAGCPCGNAQPERKPRWRGRVHAQPNRSAERIVCIHHQVNRRLADSCADFAWRIHGTNQPVIRIFISVARTQDQTIAEFWPALAEVCSAATEVGFQSKQV